MAVGAAAVNVNTSATALFTPTSSNLNAVTVFIQNLGPNVIYVGGSDVSSTLGVQVAATTGTLTLSRVDGTLYAVCGTLQVSPANTRVLADLD